MSYCVNCGVKLALSEPKCPLCGVEVHNPVSPWTVPNKRPYPQRIERIIRRADRHYFLLMASLMLLIPLFITLLCDLLANKTITYSAFVVGSSFLAYVFVLLPFLFDPPRLLLCIALDGAATAFFLFIVERFTAGDWFFPIGLPVTVVATLLVWGVGLLFRRFRYSRFLKAAVVLFTIGLGAVCTELFIIAYLKTGEILTWSAYTLIPCAILGVCCLVLERRRKLQDKLRRRFFI